LLDSAHDAATFQRDLNARESRRIVQELKKLGVQVVEQPDMAAFRALVYGQVRQAYADKNGLDLLNAMEAEK
jgi:TRAP-type transport system periplasmic protein